MRYLYIIIIFIAFNFILQNAYAQILNWKTTENTQHIVSANLGLDYSLSYGIGYGYKLNTKKPIIMNANFSMPSGETLFDDFKTKLGGQILLFNRANLRGVLAMNGIYRRHETKLLRLQNFGSELKGSFGYYKPKWFIAGEAGFDKAIITHFKHSQEFRENVYADVVDGWYGPTTGGNVSFGLQTGYSFRKTDLTFNLGMVKTQNFKTTTLIPFYLTVGYNYKIN